MNAKRTKIVALMVLALSPAAVATAANKYWKNSVGSGNWSGGNNWSNVSAAGADNGGAPAAGDVAHIIPTDGAARTITYDVTAPPQFITYVDLTGPGTNRTTFSMSGNTLTTQALGVGYGGRATFNHSGGTVNVIGPGLDMAVGELLNSNGIYNLSGTGALSVAHDLFVGRFNASSGTFNQSGGTNTVTNQLVIGADTFSTGSYVLSGGTLSVGNSLIVGNSGPGTLTIQGDGSASTNNLSINSSSTLNLNGGTLRFNTIGGAGGLSRINYTAGTIRLAGNRVLNIDATISDLYGGDIPAGKHLFVEGNASMADGDGSFIVNGGSLTSSSFSYNASNAGDSLSIANGGTMTTTGTARLADAPFTAGVVIASGAGSTWNINDLVVGDSDGGFGFLFVRDQSLVHVENSLSIGTSGDVRVEGGTLRFGGALESELTRIDFRHGTIQLSGNRTIAPDGTVASLFLDENLALRAGKGLTIEGTATLGGAVTIDGGTLSASQIANAWLLDLQRGTLNLTNQALTIGAGGLLGSALDVNEDMTVNVTLGITNQGLVTGDGQIGGPFANAAAGELRAQVGRSLRLTGANNTNSGQISLLGGELEFTQNLTNNAGGFISGNGSLIVGGGLMNQGTMNFAGTANIDGNVTNAVGGKIISGGGGATIFYDDVTNNGEIRTSTNGFTVFFGSVSGSGSFTGTGTVNFESDLSPGSSPATVNFAGDVVLGPESTLQIELGGTTPGTQYDQINVAGELTLDGTLEISLINGFTPSAGQTFDILHRGSLTGTFLAIELPPLPGLNWDTSQLAAGTLSVALPGDFNFDGNVNSADYVAWRKGVGVAPTPENYNLWRTNFGQPGGAGSSAEAVDIGVPEPTSLALLLLATAFAVQCCARTRTMRVSERLAYV